MAQLPAGMRNNNPGNIKFVGQQGTTPSVNTDQGDPQAVYPSQQAGMNAMYSLLLRKYNGGKLTPRQMIADQGGWTPGNVQAAANVAHTAGIGLDDNINFSDPAAAQRFIRGLLLQEHGPASNAYSDAMISSAISGGPAVTMAPAQQVLAEPQASQSGQRPGPVRPSSQPATFQPLQIAQQQPQPSSVMQGFMAPEGDWMQNRSYSTDALLSDFFAGRNPLRRFVYQKIAGLFG